MWGKVESEINRGDHVGLKNRVMKAIETKYNKYLFRSRLEARWAVYFDSLDIKILSVFDGGVAGIYGNGDQYDKAIEASCSARFENI
jgi:hypothetical protein